VELVSVKLLPPKLEVTISMLSFGSRLLVNLMAARRCFLMVPLARDTTITAVLKIPLEADLESLEFPKLESGVTTKSSSLLLTPTLSLTLLLLPLPLVTNTNVKKVNVSKLTLVYLSTFAPPTALLPQTFSDVKMVPVSSLLLESLKISVLPTARTIENTSAKKTSA
jgi:hypothetical protein